MPGLAEGVDDANSVRGAKTMTVLGKVGSPLMLTKIVVV